MMKGTVGGQRTRDISQRVLLEKKTQTAAAAW
jgi:hypothetical protein